MTTLTNCPHCGKPLVQSAQDLQPKALALLRLIGEMESPDVEKHALATAPGRLLRDAKSARPSRCRRSPPVSSQEPGGSPGAHGRHVHCRPGDTVPRHDAPPLQSGPVLLRPLRFAFFCYFSNHAGSISYSFHARAYWGENPRDLRFARAAQS